MLNTIASDIMMAINDDIIMVALYVSTMRLIIAFWRLIVASVVADYPNSIMASNESIMVAVFKECLYRYQCIDERFCATTCGWLRQITC